MVFLSTAINPNTQVRPSNGNNTIVTFILRLCVRQRGKVRRNLFVFVWSRVNGRTDIISKIKRVQSIKLTIAAEIHAHSLANSHCQQAYRHTNFICNLCDFVIVKINILTSLFHASVLLLTMNFVIHCQSSGRIHSYFDNAMTNFMMTDRTDAWKSDVNFSVDFLGDRVVIPSFCTPATIKKVNYVVLVFTSCLISC